jgi:DNA-binding transcriptional LysR family regulator
MTLEDLRVFLEVCRTASLSAAARELDCSQSAVSQHVRRLEQELSAALVVRGTKGINLTPAGEAFARAAGESLAALAAGTREVAEIAGRTRRRVRLATGSTSVRYVMSEALARFRLTHPEAQLELHSANSTSACLEALRNDLVDLAFVTLGGPMEHFEQRQLVSSSWLLVVPADHPLSTSGEAVSPAQLEQLSLITLPSGSTSQSRLEESLARAGVSLSSSTQAEDWDSAVALVEVGFGNAIVPEMPGRRLVAGRALAAMEISGLAPVGFGWAVRRWSSLSPLAVELAEMVAEELD